MSDNVPADECCPKCGSKEIESETRQEYRGEVTWADGLGSPGPLFLPTTYYTCKSCGRVWS